MRSICYRAGMILVLAVLLTGCGGSSTADSASKGLTAEQMKANLPKDTKTRLPQR
ncbi:MAG: hypothetical protein JWO38_694 [Gemmataceae bacterium]|nr:hypothetical protein [Gemmataceae bacterium]